jgi:putative transcriptional regulator
VFAGYAGWDADQLDGEIQEGSWFVVDAADSDLGSTEPTTLWRDVLRRQPGDMRLLATFPPDAGLN